METGRRNFLKIGGICALGLGSLRVVNALGKTETPPKFMANLQGLSAKRWAMAIDMKKCWEKGPPGCTDCVLACHSTHNVPDIGTQKEEIKWIWEEKYENAFPGQQSGMEPEAIREKPFMVLCNHCKNAPCTRVCPTQATFKRADGITAPGALISETRAPISRRNLTPLSRPGTGGLSRSATSAKNGLGQEKCRRVSRRASARPSASATLRTRAPRCEKPLVRNIQ